MKKSMSIEEDQIRKLTVSYRVVMALIHGINSKFNCPICLVPSDQLSKITQYWPLRDATMSQNLIKQARVANLANDRERLLKSQSLQNVNNAFWPPVSPNLCWDRLHSNGGIFHDHLFPEFKKFLAQSLDVHNITAKIDDWYVTFYWKHSAKPLLIINSASMLTPLEWSQPF